MNLAQLDSWIDWDGVMAAPRYAGGHSEVMCELFRLPVEIIASYIQDDYQGEEAFAYRFPDGSVVLITDWFGSCSGCDMWEDSTDEEARAMVLALVHNARIKPSMQQHWHSVRMNV